MGGIRNVTDAFLGFRCEMVSLRRKNKACQHSRFSHEACDSWCTVQRLSYIPFVISLLALIACVRDWCVKRIFMQIYWFVRFQQLTSLH
eukprot:6179835-Pleurochrysis_carterae.AAC.1